MRDSLVDYVIHITSILIWLVPVILIVILILILPQAYSTTTYNCLHNSIIILIYLSHPKRGRDASSSRDAIRTKSNVISALPMLGELAGTHRL